jgi:hypothetical protein
MPTYFHVIKFTNCEVCGVTALQTGVAVSISDAVIWIFYLHNTSDRNMALVSSEPLTEMSTRSISWGQRLTVHTADNLAYFMS